MSGTDVRDLDIRKTMKYEEQLRKLAVFKGTGSNVEIKLFTNLIVINKGIMRNKKSQTKLHNNNLAYKAVTSNHSSCRYFCVH